MKNSFIFYIDSKLEKTDPSFVDGIKELLSSVAIFKSLDLYESKKFSVVVKGQSNEEFSFSKKTMVFEYVDSNLNLFETANPDYIQIRTNDDFSMYEDLILSASKSTLREIAEECQNYQKKIKGFNSEHLAYEAYQAFVLESYNYDNYESFISFVNEFSFANCEIQIKAICDLAQTDRVIRSLPQSYYLTSDSEKFEELALIIYLLELVIERFKLSLELNDGNMLELAFLSLTFPVAIFDEKKNLILHNSHFSGIGFSNEALSLYENDDVFLGANEKKYKIYKKEIKEDPKLIVLNFIEISEDIFDIDMNSSEELGIISSSIAHELNNPLGGVLAAIDVMQLDDLEEDLDDKLTQMKEGVLRCKDLVQTFLGFSRKKQLEYFGKLNFSENFQQALALTRFRLVEGNISLCDEYSCQDSFQLRCNPYVLTMTLYLILGEIITSHSRDQLIQNSSDADILNLKLVEDKEYVTFSFDSSIYLSPGFLKSKLFVHLKEELGVDIKLKESSFAIYAALKDD